MRVLMVTDFYRPYVGGVEQHVRSLAQALVRLGHHVAVATLWTPGSGPREELDGEVRIYRLRSAGVALPRLFTSAERPWAPPILDPFVVAGLRRVVAREQPDLLHGHDWLARSAWPVCLGRRPLVLSLHYYTRSCAKKTRWTGGAPCAGPSLRRCVPCASAHFGRAKGVVTVGANRLGAAIDDRVARQLIAVSDATARGNEVPTSIRCRTVPNLLPASRGSAVAAPAGLPAEPFILYVGDLRREKGLDVLLDAYPRLSDGAPPLVLLGERHGRSVDDLPPGVVAIGPVTNEEVLATWRRCLFGVVPSVWAEPFGIVVIEAMAAGKTIVASDVGGIPEIVRPGRSGLLVAPGDPAALASAMQRLIDDGALRTRLEIEACRQVRGYRADVVAGEVERVYADALRDRGRARRGP